jgi:Ca2+-binding RTX toxin-like protein
MAVRLLPIALALALLGAAPAGASTATWRQGTVEPPDTPPEESCSRYMLCEPSELAVVGDPGERNVLTVRIVGSDAVITDTGGQLKAGKGCREAAGGAVTCPAAEHTVVRGGDGDDTVTAEPPVAGNVFGEDGNDVLRGSNLDGGPGNDTLTGTDQSDSLIGGPGADRVDAGAGDDSIFETESPAAPDVIDGGPGLDLVLFGTRRRPITADLGPDGQVAGAPGEGNLVTGLESVFGGSGDDVVTLRVPPAAPRQRAVDVDLGAGDDRLVALAPVMVVAGDGADVVTAGPGRDFLYGGRGADRLDGGAGSDQVQGDGGRDVLRGGDGSDVLFARDRRADRVDCGAGRDRLVGDRRDRRSGCERLFLARQ